MGEGGPPGSGGAPAPGLEEARMRLVLLGSSGAGGSVGGSPGGLGVGVFLLVAGRGSSGAEGWLPRRPLAPPLAAAARVLLPPPRGSDEEEWLPGRARLPRPRPLRTSSSPASQNLEGRNVSMASTDRH